MSLLSHSFRNVLRWLRGSDRERLPPAVGESPRARKGRRVPRVWIAIAVLYVLLAIVGATKVMDPFRGDIRSRLMPPFSTDSAGTLHILGTDELGRDLLSRLIGGAKESLLAAVFGVFLGTAIGLSLGVLSGYYGGIADALVGRAVNVFMALPVLLIALLFALAVGPGLWTVVIAAGALQWARFARIARAETLSIRERPFVYAARGLGATDRKIIIRHILPNIRSSILVLATLQLGSVVHFEATLSFLGAGIPAPAPAWGSILAAGRAYMRSAWWLTICPGLAITLLVLTVSRLGDWMRDTLDPKLREKIEETVL